MRSRSIVASLVSVAVLGGGVAAVANPASDTTLDFTNKVSTKKSGTKKKPRPITANLTIKGDTKSGTGQPATSTRLVITLPKGWRANGKIWPRKARCSAAAANRAKDDGVCPRGSKIGSGSTDVAAANGAIVRTLRISNYVLTTGDLGFFIRSNPSEPPNVTQMLPGKVRGRKVTVAIPSNVQEPIDGVPTGIKELKVKVGGTARVRGKRRGIFETTSCPRAGWITKLTDVYRDGRGTDSSKVQCRR